MTARTRRPGRSGTSTSTALGPDPAGGDADGGAEESTPITSLTDPPPPAAPTTPPAGAPATLPPGAEPVGVTAPNPSDVQVAPAARTAADIAAQRRAALDTTPAAPVPGGPPVAGQVPDAVVASATLRAQFAGDGTPGRPTGGVWNDRPLVLQIQPGAAAGQAAQVSNYVIAECDAQESTILPGMQTAVNKRVWTAGQLVYRPFYEAVMAEHARRVAEGVDGEPVPAELPAGRTELPPDVVADQQPGDKGDPADTSAPTPGETSMPGAQPGDQPGDDPADPAAPPVPPVSP